MRLKCLSIQQPWADLILDGKKLVENRTWPWMRHRIWQREGSVLLAIHASRNLATWRDLTDKERDAYAPGWRDRNGPTVGAVLGVVDLVQICRPKDLPLQLRKHKFAKFEPDNWCWVLKNPRRFARPIQAKANVFINLEVPDKTIERASSIGGR